MTNKNIDRGTTDLGSVTHLFDKIYFVLILAAETTQVSDSTPWVRCASGNVYKLSHHMAPLSKATSGNCEIHKMERQGKFNRTRVRSLGGS